MNWDKIHHYEVGKYFIRAIRVKHSRYRWYFNAMLKGKNKPEISFGSHALTFWGAKRDANRKLER